MESALERITHIPVQRAESLVEKVVLSPDVILEMNYGPEIHREWYQTPMRFVSLRYQNDSPIGHPTFFPNGCSFLQTSGRHALFDALTTPPKKMLDKLMVYMFTKIDQMRARDFFASKRMMLFREIKGIPPIHIRDLSIVVTDILPKKEFRQYEQWCRERENHYNQRRDELIARHLPPEIEHDQKMELFTAFEIETCDLYLRLSRVPYEMPVKGKAAQDYTLLVASRKFPLEMVSAIHDRMLRILQQ